MRLNAYIQSKRYLLHDHPCCSRQKESWIHRWHQEGGHYNDFESCDECNSDFDNKVKDFMTTILERVVTLKLLEQQQPPAKQVAAQMAQLVPTVVIPPAVQPAALTAMEVVPPPEKASSVQVMDTSGPGAAELVHEDGEAGPSDMPTPSLPLLTMMATPKMVDQSMPLVFAVDDSDEQTEKEKKKSKQTVFMNPTKSVDSADFEEEGELEVVAQLMALEGDMLKLQKKVLDVCRNMVVETDHLNEWVARKGQYITPGDNHLLVFRYLVHFEHTILTDSEVETGKLDKLSLLEDRKAHIELAIKQREGAEQLKPGDRAYLGGAVLAGTKQK